MTKVFISHSWEDKNLAHWLAEKLKQSGVDIWIDHQRLKCGDNLPKRVSDALEWCDTLILLWSTKASNSYWVEMEWTSAISMGRLIIPCLIDSTSLPAILTSALSISFKDKKEGFRKLHDTFSVASFKGKLEQIEEDILVEFEYIGAIKGKVSAKHGDEVHLYLKLGANEKYSRFVDGCGPYGYLCWVRFGSIFSNNLFASFFYKRISDMPLEFRLYGGNLLIGDEEFLSWERIKDTRVDNLHFDMFAKKGSNYQEALYELARIVRKSRNSA